MGELKIVGRRGTKKGGVSTGQEGSKEEEKREKLRQW